MSKSVLVAGAIGGLAGAAASMILRPDADVTSRLWIVGGVAVATATLWFVYKKLFKKAKGNEPPKQLQVGLVGLGSISSFYINAINNNSTDLALKAVCDVNKPDDMSKYGSAKYFSDYKKMIDSGLVDTVFIATPPSTHIEIIEYAASKKKKVLVEKPIGIALDECQRATSIASKNNTHLYFAYHAAFAPAFLRVKEMIAQHTSKGEQITKFSVTYKEDVRKYHKHGAWIFNPKISGGGCLIDSGINAISSVEDVLGKINPTKVTLSTDAQYTVETKAEVDFVSDDNPSVTGHLSQDWLWTGPTEERKFTYWLSSGKMLEFNMVAETVTYTMDGDEVVFNITSRKNLDGNLTPMAAEYENLMKDAIRLFRDNTRNFNRLATGPFLTVSECYKKAK